MKFWQLFVGYLAIAYLPGVFYQNVITFLWATALPGVILFYENRHNSKITKMQLRVFSALFPIIIFIALMIVNSIPNPIVFGPAWQRLLIPPLFLLCYHFFAPSFKLKSKSLESSDNQSHRPNDTFKKYATNPLIASTALGAVLAWGGYSYFVGAYKAASQTNYVSYCTYERKRVADKFYQKNVAKVNSKFAKKQMGVLGLSLFSKLLNQPFGDRNYKRYIDKYGTNPYDTLSGGALSKGPKVLGKIVASQKATEIGKIRNLRNQYTSKSGKVCSCQFNAAFSKLRTDWTTYAMTFKMVRSSPIATGNFRRLADSNSRACTS